MAGSNSVSGSTGSGSGALFDDLRAESLDESGLRI
jgi:hypothetical protein